MAHYRTHIAFVSGTIVSALAGHITPPGGREMVFAILTGDPARRDAVPVADREELRRLSDLLVHREPGVHDVPPEGMAGGLELIVYYAQMLAQAKALPQQVLSLLSG